MKKELELPKLKREDFVFTFESKGTTLIFEDMVTNYYMPNGESISIFYNGRKRVFCSKQQIEKMRKEGETRSIRRLKKVIGFLKDLIKRVNNEIPIYKKKDDLNLDDVRHMIDLMAKICKEYLYFDYLYWDSIYETAKKDKTAKENIKLVESFKNNIRIDINNVFFGLDSYLSILLEKISRQFAISVEELSWYTLEDLLNLFANKKIAVEETESRRKACFYYKTESDLTFYYGKIAEEFIFKFDKLNNRSENIEIIKGKIAYDSGKKISGKIKVISRDYGEVSATRKAIAQMNAGDILVTETTDPELLPAIRKAGGIITDVGGMLSHAAITARELGKTCIIETEFASKVLKDGDLVEIDANNGIVRILERKV